MRYDYYGESDCEQDRYDRADLDLRDVWKCGTCGRQIEVEPGQDCSGLGGCPCGGEYQRAGESYNSDAASRINRRSRP